MYNSRSLTYAILIVGLSASVFGIIGFLNTAYADTQNMTDTTKTNATATASSGPAGNTNMTQNTNMTHNTNMTQNMNMTNSTKPVTTPPPAPKMMDPLHQFKAGTPAKTVQCGQGLSLVIKVEDGSPACVSSSIAQVLVARGWGTTA